MFCCISFISQYSKISRASGVSNDPLYSLSPNQVFTAPEDGYARVSAEGYLSALNLKDGTYIIICVVRENYPTTQIDTPVFIRKGTPIKWTPDDGTTAIVFIRIVS